MARRKLKCFVLTVVDRDTNQFSIEGPMHDDSTWIKAVSEAHDAGRDVQCYSGDGTLADIEQAAAEWQHDYPLHRRVAPGTIVSAT